MLSGAGGAGSIHTDNDADAQGYGVLDDGSAQQQYLQQLQHSGHQGHSPGSGGRFKNSQNIWDTPISFGNLFFISIHDKTKSKLKSLK